VNFVARDRIVAGGNRGEPQADDRQWFDKGELPGRLFGEIRAEARRIIDVRARSP
jgi:hypothetical protein